MFYCRESFDASNSEARCDIDFTAVHRRAGGWLHTHRSHDIFHADSDNANSINVFLSGKNTATTIGTTVYVSQ